MRRLGSLMPGGMALASEAMTVEIAGGRSREKDKLRIHSCITGRPDSRQKRHHASLGDAKVRLAVECQA